MASSSSVAMVATMSHVAVPEMRRAGYDERLTLGSTVAGATLGILFPPSVMLIFYGLTAVQSIPKLFAAGFIPGLILATLQIGVVKTAIWLRLSRSMVSRNSSETSASEAMELRKLSLAGVSESVA